MKPSFPFFATLLCLILFGLISCKKNDDTTVTPGTTPGTTTKSSAKEIKTFSFAALSPAVTGTIDATAKTISATVPSGTDLTKLVPTITLSDKATISPASGVVQDFSKAVTYTVTAEDGSTQAYIATVIKEGATTTISSDQVTYYFTTEVKTDNTTGKNSIIKSIVAIDALTGKNSGSFNLGTEIPNNSSPYISTYLAGASGDGKDAYPRLYDNGILYTFQTKQVNAIDAKTGAKKWSSTIDDFSSSGGEPVVDNGILFVSGFLGKHIYALEVATGKQKWDFVYAESINTFTASNGLLYIGYGDINYSGGLLAVDIATGKEKWNVKTFGVSTNPAVVNGIVYYGDAKKKVYAVDAATGAKKWEFTTGDMVLTSPTVSDGIVYVGSEDRKLYALDAATGTKKWEFTAAGTKSTYGGIITDTDYTYFSAYNGTAFVIYALDKKTGTKKWETTTSEQGVPVVANGILYFAQQAVDAAAGTNKNWGLKGLKTPCIVLKGKFYASSNSGMVQ